MVPDKFGLLAASMLISSPNMFRRATVNQRTDADRLRDLDAAEARHIAKITSPGFLAAQAKRERKRQKLLSLPS